MSITLLFGSLLSLAVGALADDVAAPAAADAAPSTTDVAPPPATAPSSAADALSEAELALVDGPPGAVVRVNQRLFVAQARGGIAVIDVAGAEPRRAGTLLPDALVTALVHDGDHLLAFVVSEDVVRLNMTDAGAGRAVRSWPRAVQGGTDSPQTPKAAALAHASGRVVEVTEGRIVFEMQKSDAVQKPFARGERVQVRSQRLVKKPDLKNGGTIDVPEDNVTAVVAVEEAGEKRAMAVLGRGDVASVGDLVFVTDDALSESLWLPRRAPFTWRMGFHARPFLGLLAKGFPVGALVDSYVSYTFEEWPISLGLDVSPIGIGLFSANFHYPSAAGLTASYVTDFFEVGLGVGGLVGNQGPCTVVQEFDQDGQVKKTSKPQCESNTGATFNQVLRLGAVDGVHLAWTSSIFARGTGFVLGTGRAEALLPVSSRVSLFSAGGVGENGFGFGEIGVRTAFGGTGGPGTVLLSASLGGAGVFDGPGVRIEDTSGLVTYTRDVVAGPSIGFGMEWRP